MVRDFAVEGGGGLDGCDERGWNGDRTFFGH